MKVWLDDVRTPPDSVWEWAKTADEAIKLLETGQVSRISLDHDLGKNVKTGYDVCKWIELKTATEGFMPPGEMFIHSANPVGKKNMLSAIEQIRKLYESNQE